MSGQQIQDIIAIDGPAGAGKSSIAREAARVLGYRFLDTGAMYRAATWWVLRQGVNLDDAAAVAGAVRAMPLELRPEDGGARVFVAGEDVSAAIRDEAVTRQIHRIDQIPEVRAHLVALQRAFGAEGPAVAEGRDMGTVVFPGARCKIYLDASLETRARRRLAELEARGVATDFAAVRDAMAERDTQNMTRKEAPLRKAPDATVVDTTDLAFDDVVNQVVALARKTGPSGPHAS